LEDTLSSLAEWHTFLGSYVAPKTQAMYWRVAFRYLREHPKPLEQHTEMDVAGWLETFPYRSSARTTYHNALKSLFSWAVRNGHHPGPDPTISIPTVSPRQKVPRALSAEEVELVRKAAYARHPMRGYTIDVLYYTAARIGETLALKWGDLDEEGIVFKHTKNGKERRVFWTPGLRAATDGLYSLFGEKDRVIPRGYGTVASWITTAGTDAGIPHVHAHLFRSTAATRMVSEGARLMAVRDILGHSKLSTTSIYLATSKGDMKEALNLL